METRAATQSQASTAVAVVKPPIVSSEEREKEKREDVEEPKATAQNQASTTVAAANPPVVASKEREREKVEGEKPLAPPLPTVDTLNFNLPNTAMCAQGTERKDFFENANRLDISQFGVHFEPDCTYIQTSPVENGIPQGYGFSSARCTIFKSDAGVSLDIFNEVSGAGESYFPSFDRDHRFGAFLGFEVAKDVRIGPEVGVWQNFGQQESLAGPFVGVGLVWRPKFLQ